MTARDGAYVVPQLKPGSYRVVVELAGFKTATVDEIKLDVQQIRAVDVRLDVGGTSETMTVAATLAPVAMRVPVESIKLDWWPSVSEPGSSSRCCCSARRLFRTNPPDGNIS